jgi:polysaccharide deacetylase family protein (PEP-CTERM system associated)
MCNRVVSEPAVVITIDVEDWPQSTLDTSLEITDRVVTNTHRVLDILGNHQRKATMFVLGKVAERFPGLVKRIAHEGHEVASHGYSHSNIGKQTVSEFRDDIERSKKLLEDIIGKEVSGYRAPDFSVTSGTLWALDVLAEVGFTYDSSIFPIRGSRYGIPWWPTYPVLVRLMSGRSIAEFPLATFQCFRRRWPVAGGGYHRLFPGFFVKWCIAQHFRQNVVFVAYYHPYEFAPEEFSVLPFAVPLKLRLHQGLGRHSLRAKFESILRKFHSVPCGRVVLSNLPLYQLESGAQ